MSTIEVRQFRAFGVLVATEAARDLAILDEIQRTLDFIDVELLKVAQSNRSAELLIEMASKSDVLIDDTGDLVLTFEKSRDTIHNIYSGLKSAKQSAIEDIRLHEDDGIVEGLDLLINAFAELHNNLNRLSWVLGENAADHDKTADGVFNNADDLFAAMGV